MNRKIIFSIASIVLLLNILFINLASANLVVDPAKLGILRLQLFPLSPAVAIREFRIGNTYDVPMRIEMTAVEDMENLITISEANFTLQPKENKTVEYTVTINEPGYYSGGILVKATAGSMSTFGYKADLAVFVSRSNLEPYIYAAIAAVVLAIALAFILIFRKSMRKKTKKGRKMRYEKVFATFFFLALFSLLFTSDAFALTAALVVKDAKSLSELHERRIELVLKEMGFDITLVDKDVTVDYNNFDLIVVAGRPMIAERYQLDSFVANIPVNDVPTIGIDYAYLVDWDWAKSPGISSYVSSKRQDVYITKENALTWRFFLGERVYVHLIQGYNIIDILDGYTNLQSVASASQNEELGVIRYGLPGTTLYDGKKISNDSAVVFFGITYPVYWTSEAEQLFKNAVDWLTKDRDGDGLKDYMDNCYNTPNADQKDADKDGMGDACDPIFDYPKEVSRDVDSDGKMEVATDANDIYADGYEVYSDPNSNTKTITLDGDSDGMHDYLIDIAKNGTYEKYWDPDDDTLTNVAYSGSNMVLIDTNGDGAFDISFNLATGLASYLDQVAPSVGAITITPSWGSSTWYKFNISAAVSDNTGINPSSCQYTIDGTNWLTADYSAGKCYKNNVQSSIGNTLTINVRVKDVAGSTGVGTTISKTVAKRPLTVTVTLDKSTYSAGEVVNASGYVSYSDSGEKLPSININYSVASVAGNAQADTTSYYAFSFTAPSSGSYTLAVTAENSYSSGSGTASFTIPSAQSSSNGSNAGIIDIIMPSRITAEASSSASFEVTIKNVGTATLHSVKVKADGMPSSVEPNDIYDIDPDDSQVFTVTLDAPSTPGEYIIKITALSMEYNPIKYLSVVVTEKPMPKLNAIGITVPQLEEGKPAEIVLTIENTGAASTTATVTVSMPTGWVADDITKNIDIVSGAEEVSFIMTPSVSGVLRFITTYEANGEKTITNTTEVEVKPKESLIPIGLTGMLVAVASDPAVSIPASLAFVGVLGLKFKKKISSLFERFRSSESVAPARKPRHRASSYDSWERRYKRRK